MGIPLKASRSAMPAFGRLLAGSLLRGALSLMLLAWPAAIQAHSQLPQPPAPAPADPTPGTLATDAPDPQAGSVAGVVTSPDGSVYQGVHVTLQPVNPSAGPAVGSMQTITNADGRFRFSAVPVGRFQLTFSCSGFATQTLSDTLHPGEDYEAKPVVLVFATATSEVEVSASQTEIATEQLHMEEEQRVLGVIPNFYVVYSPNAVPLSPRQKFHLAWRTEIDPITIAASAASAGVEQAENTFSGYGQGAQGYFKRFGANYADSLIGNMLGGALFPAVFKQDPRYFYNGKGTIRHRALYAIANAVICKGDNGHWQFNYSGLLGSMAAGGVSYTYYPASNRDGAGLFIENTFIGIGGSAIGNLFQEFLVRKLTPHVPNYSSNP